MGGPLSIDARHSANDKGTSAHLASLEIVYTAISNLAIGVSVHLQIAIAVSRSLLSAALGIGTEVTNSIAFHPFLDPFLTRADQFGVNDIDSPLGRLNLNGCSDGCVAVLQIGWIARRLCRRQPLIPKGFSGLLRPSHPRHLGPQTGDWPPTGELFEIVHRCRSLPGQLSRTIWRGTKPSLNRVESVQNVASRFYNRPVVAGGLQLGL